MVQLSLSHADTNVSLSNFLIATTDRLSQYVDGEEYNNPWGYGNIQMAKFAEETKTMYELLLAACPCPNNPVLTEPRGINYGSSWEGC